MLLDEAGLEGLSMRSLAAKLGIKASSLYWHLHSKQDLLGLLAEEIVTPMGEPDRSLPWTEQLTALAYEYRRVLRLHRDAARVLASSGGPSGPKRLRLAELVLRTLQDAGFEPQDVAYAGLLVNDYVTMFVAGEQYSGEEAADRPDSGMQDWFGRLPKDEYPSLIALAPYLAQVDEEESFRFGMQILIAGLQTRLAKSKD